MLFIVFATITSVLMLVIVRLFEKNKAHTFYALIFNYLSALTIGFTYSSIHLKSKDIHFIQIIYSLPYQVWLITIIEGILFITVFYWIAQTTRYYGIAVASVANKMSFIFPVLSAHFLFNDELNTLQALALLLAIFSVYLVTYSPNLKIRSDANKIIFPFLVFIGSGIIDSLINYGNKTFVNTEDRQYVFSTFVYGFALLTGFIYIKTDTKKIFYQDNFKWKSTIGLGLLLGIPNFFNLVFIIQALNTRILPSGQIFLILNLSNVITTALIGVFIFKEKLSWMNWLGIILAILSMVLIQQG